MVLSPIILASQSPRRKQLLEWAEIAFEIMVSDTDESFPDGLSFSEAAIFIARNKALTIQQMMNTEKTILAADTIVVCAEKILGKPGSRAEAVQTLQQLSGKTHQVITGVVMLNKEKETAFADITEVTFYPLTDDQIFYYVDKYQPYDKAGAYAIQEWVGVTGIKSINGDFYNVMGLPVSRVVKELAAFAK